jgi:hypothetical protein
MGSHGTHHCAELALSHWKESLLRNPSLLIVASKWYQKCQVHRDVLCQKSYQSNSDTGER